MSIKPSRAVLISLICVFSVLLSLAGCAGTPDVPQTTAPVTQATAEPTTVPTTAPATQATAEPTTVPTTVPLAGEFVLSFVGDCCLGHHKGVVTESNFLGLVDGNFSWPFAGVQQYFATDDCTFINLESVLTESETFANKKFVFKAPTRFKSVLTEGSVEFANVVNNHSMDYLEAGYQDTTAALDSIGVHYAHQQDYVIFTTDSGLTIGVYSDMFAMNLNGLNASNAKAQAELLIDKMTAQVAQMRQEGAEVIIAAMHWGEEYWYKTNKYQKQIARAAIDAGVDIVWGHHPHVLQPVEEYNGGIIFYSLGNFSFGGSSHPADKDSVIMQQTVIRDADGTISLGNLDMIPCRLASQPKGNDFQPTPRDPESEEYARTMQKLKGKYPLQKINPSYREDLSPTEPTEAETVPATTPATEPTVPMETAPAETAPAETAPAETAPAETAPAETAPAETAPTPVETTPTPVETTPTPVETTPTPVETTPVPAETATTGE